METKQEYEEKIKDCHIQAFSRWNLALWLSIVPAVIAGHAAVRSLRILSDCTASLERLAQGVERMTANLPTAFF